MPRGTAAAAIGAEAVAARVTLRATTRKRSNASSEYSTASAASAANGRADSESGNPRAACPSRTAMYQRTGRIAPQACENAFIPNVGKPTPA